MKRMVELVFVGTVSSVLLVSLISWAGVSPREIYKEKGPAVVLIVASQEGSSSASAGTGSILRPEGTVITNCHVIFDESTKASFPVIHVFMKPEKVTGDMEKDLSRHFTGKVVAFDRDLDLAMLQIENPPAGLPTVTLGNPNDVGPGDETVAIGHPEQGGLWTITTGVIGTEFENFKGIAGKDVFQMETSLNRGNSGGPLFDVRGYQIGVNTAIARKGEGGVAITGVNFALKASVVQKWLQKQSVMVAYGNEKLSAPADTRVAAADKPKESSLVSEPPVASPPKDNAVSSKPASTLEPGAGQPSDTVSANRPVEPAKSSPPPEKKPKHKPERFGERFKSERHDYTYKRLFTEVDKVRARAQEAFDDLDKEIQRRSH
jgi:serine protease Do